MKRKILWLGLSFLLVAALVLTACPAPVVEEPVVEEPVVEEPVVEEPVVEEPVVEEPVVRPLLLSGQGLAPATGETVVFQGWAYKTHIVEDNVKRYNTEMRGNVAYDTVTGDYPMLIEMGLVAATALDMFYGTISQAVRYYEGGWVLPAEELPNIDAIKADMYPHILDALTYDGKLLGLPYFVSVIGMIQVNLKALNELGFTEADYPATWDELYDQLFEFREKGFKHAFLPWWYGTWSGIGFAYSWEVLNRGGMIADPDTHAPMVTVDGPAGDTLRAWKRVFNAGLIPREILGYTEAEHLEAWGSGKYIYSQQHHYDLMKFNDPVYSAFAGYNDFLPYQGQPWGILFPAMYLMSDRPRSPEHTDDVMRFASWYGWKDHEGETFVALRWMEDSMLFSAYKSVMEHPDTAGIIKAGLAANPDKYDALLELYEHSEFPKGSWTVIWAPELQAWLLETLSKFLIDDLPVDETIEAIRDKINELNAFYGVGG